MPTPEDDYRRAWLSRWKEWAIEQLPKSASAAMRSRTRLEVERALTRLGTQDAKNEICDLVQATLDPILLELANRDTNDAHARQKHEYLERAEAYLEIALVLMAGARTTAMLNRHEYARPVLIERLRHRFRRLLTGAESHAEVFEHTIEFLDQSLAEQPPPPSLLAGDQDRKDDGAGDLAVAPPAPGP